MRKLMSAARSRAADERGATAVIVALSLIALFGMLVLVVDVGGLLLTRRAMVNGSDAAALAAAKSCVLPASTDPRTAEQAADEWAAKNASKATTGPTNITAISGCDTDASGYVSVKYSSPQDLFFAPVLGGSNEGQVATAATAIWGPPGEAPLLPLVVYANSYHTCKLDKDALPGPLCYVWEDNGNTQGAQSGFGWLDLRTDRPTQYGWNSNKGAVCTNTNTDQWIKNYPDPSVGQLPTNYPAPTYVCRLSGNQQNAWQSLYPLIDDDDSVDHDDNEDILFFPINRCYASVTGNETDGQVAAGGTPIRCGDIPNQYDIVGFVGFKLEAIYTPLQAQATMTTCGPFPFPFPSSNGLNLDTVGISNNCFTTAPLYIDPATVKVDRIGSGNGNPQPQRGPDGTTCSGTTYDWCYNPTARTINWNVFGPAPEPTPQLSYDVSFSWSVGGPCGIPPQGNNSGHCLVVRFVNVALGGSHPGGGSPDSNLRAFKLCEPKIPSTCAPIVVPVT